MRTLLFVGTNAGPGGTESHLVSLVLAMADAGHRVGAVVRPGDYIHRALEADGRVQLFPAFFKRAADPRATLAVARAVRAMKPDHLVGTFSHEYWGLVTVSAALGVPLVVFRHVRRLSRTAARVLPLMVERVLLPSNWLRDWMVNRGMPRDRTAVLYNPVDVSRFRPDAALRAASRRQFGFRDDDVVVGYLGRFDEQKGVRMLPEVLERAMKQDANIRALWVGHGEEGADIEERIRTSSHHDRHVIAPWSAEIISAYAAMDVVAFPSMRHEAFGRVSIEAQSFEIPVLASNVGGVPESMRDGETGVLLPAGDVEAWTSALVALAGDPERRRRMGRAGRELVTSLFAAPRIAESFDALLGPRR
ncbi:MAG: glycosyl transferase group 1 [Gemmatimonadetes bacterium]|nr:glycosyl transferase group 1 [Gemmatimonadota bacterium]